VHGGDAMLAAFDSSHERILAGRSVPVNENLPEGIRQLIQGITQPVNQPFPESCGHLIRSPLAEVTVPVLIVIARRYPG
jgi:hypothetical protein